MAVTTSGLLAGAGAAPAVATAPATAATPGDIVTFSLATHQLTLLHNGSPVRLGRLSHDIDAAAARVYRATGGLVFESGNVVEQVTSSGTVRSLSSGSFATSVVVGNAGHQIAWVESTTDGSTVRFVDESHPQHVISTHLPFMAVPVGILGDGRVAIGHQFNSGTPVLWRPATQQLRTLHGVLGLDSASGHTLVLSRRDPGCATALLNVDTGADTKVGPVGCELVLEPSPDGRRWLGTNYGLLVTATASTGAYDQRLGHVMSTMGWSAVDQRWLDNEHVQLIGTAIVKGKERAADLTCRVPVSADPTCQVVRDFGIVAGSNLYSQNPPSVYLVH